MSAKTRVVFATLIIAVAFGGARCSNSPSVSDSLPSALRAAEPLLETVTKAVPGLSQAQAIVGSGSLLGLAKAKMPVDSFSQVSTALPGADALIAEAATHGMSSAPSGLGEVSSFLGKSGISASQVSQIARALSGALQGKVPETVSSAFTSALQ